MITRSTVVKSTHSGDLFVAHFVVLVDCDRVLHGSCLLPSSEALGEVRRR
jgi:hypothetical protein